MYNICEISKTIVVGEPSEIRDRILYDQEVDSSSGTDGTHLDSKFKSKFVLKLEECDGLVKMNLQDDMMILQIVQRRINAIVYKLCHDDVSIER